MQAIFAYKGFYAIDEHPPGGERLVRVGGTIVFRHLDWSAELRLFEGDANLGINPFNLLLDLVLREPPGGPQLPEVRVAVALTELRLEPVLNYREVRFRVVGTQDVAPEPVLVERFDGAAPPPDATPPPSAPPAPGDVR